MNSKEDTKVIKSCWDSYYEKTASTSAVCRQFSYAGIAVIWILASNDAGEILRNASLLFATLGFVSALGFEFFHYFGSSVVWHFYCKWVEKKAQHKGLLSESQSEEDYNHPKHINIVAEACFVAKCFCLLFGYLSLAKYLFLAANAAT